MTDNRPTLPPDAVLEVAARFRLGVAPTTAHELRSGHINDSFVIAGRCGGRGLLQRINRHVFAEPHRLMNNLERITRHLADRPVCAEPTPPADPDSSGQRPDVGRNRAAKPRPGMLADGRTHRGRGVRDEGIVHRPGLSRRAGVRALSGHARRPAAPAPVRDDSPLSRRGQPLRDSGPCAGRRTVRRRGQPPAPRPEPKSRPPPGAGIWPVG